MRIDELAILLLLALIVGLLAVPVQSLSAPDVRPRKTIPLSGYWEFLPEHENEAIQNGDSYSWGRILAPALWGNAENIDPKFSGTGHGADAKAKLSEVPYCWYRRKFTVDADMEGLNCILRIVDIRWSAEVWLNGVRLGDHLGGYRPVDFDATAAVRPGKENVIVIKQGGGHTIPTYDDGVPKIPFGHKGWAKGASGIMGDIDLRFFRNVEVSRVKIDSDIHNETCRVALGLANHGASPQAVSVEMKVYERKSGKALPGSHQVSGAVDGNKTFSTTQTIKIDRPSLWSPQDPFLYSLQITVKDQAGRVCDSIRQNFGMREFVAKDGHFFLNGKRIYLRGATDLAITAFPSWGSPALMQTDPKWIKKYLVDGAREMNANVFRTHMGPWYKAFYDTADENGILLISEFPNWPPEGGEHYYEHPGFADKLYSEMELMAANLWNHPSIIIWAACNEPYIWDYNKYENEVLVPWFKKMDPTRPVMRAGAASADIADCHNYEGFWTGTIGDHIGLATHVKNDNPGKPLCDTEYLETSPKAFSNPEWGRAQKWMGYHVSLQRAEEIHALFAMEQTEIKRRLGFDGLLPFWFGMLQSKGQKLGEERWQSYYALKNSLAPVAVSLGLIERHFSTASDLKLQVWAMNDLEKAQKGKINIYVVREEPPYIYAGPPAAPLAKSALNVDIPPYSATPHEVTVRLPNEEGSYWLYATLHVRGRETVISKHPIHVLDRAKSLAPAKGEKIAVIEEGTAVQDWAKSVGVEIRPVETFDYQTLIIGRDSLASEMAKIGLAEAAASEPRGHIKMADVAQLLEKAKTAETGTEALGKIGDWINAGGRLVILDQGKWPQGLFDIELQKKRDVSYLFKEKGQENDPVWRGIADAYMENWNGSGAEGLRSFFTRKSPGTTLAIGSSDQEGLNARALLRLPMGKGEILACQILVAERLTPGTPTFDPVAERLMVNLITAQ